MKRSNRIVLILLVFIGILYPQKNDLKFEHISVEDGLSQSTIHSIIQDSYGFIWIGTEDGLNRFDGYNFVLYRNDREDSTSLASNQIRTIIQDNNGIIWAGTNNGLSALTLFTDNLTQNTKEGFYNYFNNPDDSNSISDDDIRCLYQDKFGVIWIGTTGGLNNVKLKLDDRSGFYDFENIKFNRTSFNSEFTKATSKTFISAITEDGNGNLWLGTMGKGLMVFNRRSGMLVTYKSNPSDPKSIGSNYIIKLFTDHAGRVWIGTYGGGLNRFDHTNKNFIRYLSEPNNANSISENKVYAFIDDKDGNLWVGTFSGGLNKFDTKTNRFTHYKNNHLDPFSLSNDFIRCVLLDRSGNLWLGTNDGISKTDLKPPKFITYRNNYWDTNSLSNNFVLSFFEAKDATLWVGTNNGLDSYNQKDGNFLTHKIPHNNPKSSEGFVYSIIEDDDGYLWLGTFGGGLYKCNAEGKILKQYLHDENDSFGIVDNRIDILFNKNKNEIVIGTVSGLCVLQKKNNKFRRYLVSSKDSTVLSEKSISIIYEDKNDTYWVGTESGLIRIDPSDGSCNLFLSDKEKLQTISSNTITSILEDSKGNFWIGTEDGLNNMDRKTNTFTTYTTKDGLPNNYITSLLDDKEGNLWIATNRGISKLNTELPEGKQFRNYDTDDGLQGFEFNINSSFKNNKGEIYFGGTNGFTKFNPSELSDSHILPDVAIVEFYKLGKPELSFLQLRKTNEINIASSENFFAFEFSAFDFTNSQKNQYAYRLEGFDKDWVYINNRRFANYTNVDPGEYTFQVKASNNDGIWNENPTSIKLVIHPPFYLTWTAFIFYILLVGSSLYSIRKYELRKRRSKSEMLLKEEKEKAKLIEAQLKAEKAELQIKAFESEKELEKQVMRSRIASDLHDEIGSNLSSITLLSSLMNDKINTDTEIKKQLLDINFAAKSSAESIRDIIWFINPTSDKLSSLFSRIKETTNMMLAGINYKFQTDEINSDERINPELKRNLYLVYKEVLNNIIKHSLAKNVLINISKDTNRIKITIQDDGCGFDPFTVLEGNGLRNIRNRAELMGGTVKLISSPSQGTKIIFETIIT